MEPGQRNFHCRKLASPLLYKEELSSPLMNPPTYLPSQLEVLYYQQDNWSISISYWFIGHQQQQQQQQQQQYHHHHPHHHPHHHQPPIHISASKIRISLSSLKKVQQQQQKKISSSSSIRVSSSSPSPIIITYNTKTEKREYLLVSSYPQQVLLLSLTIFHIINPTGLYYPFLSKVITLP